MFVLPVAPMWFSCRLYSI